MTFYTTHTMLPLLTYDGEQTDERMTLTFGGWQVGELHCTHGTSSSFDHSVWPQLSSLFKTIQERMVRIMWRSSEVFPTNWNFKYFDIFNFSESELYSSVSPLLSSGHDKDKCWQGSQLCTGCFSSLQFPFTHLSQLGSKHKPKRRIGYDCLKICS